MAGIAFDKSVTTGHSSAPPTRINSTQDIVYVEGKPALVEGDSIIPHAYHDDPPHNGVVIATNEVVHIGGKRVVQIGDSITCGDTVSEGSSIVVVR